jgi:hypothetical protein
MVMKSSGQDVIHDAAVDGDFLQIAAAKCEIKDRKV